MATLEDTSSTDTYSTRDRDLGKQPSRSITELNRPQRPPGHDLKQPATGDGSRPGLSPNATGHDLTTVYPCRVMTRGLSTASQERPHTLSRRLHPVPRDLHDE